MTGRNVKDERKFRLLACTVALFLCAWSPAQAAYNPLYFQAKNAELSEKFDEAIDLYKRSMSEEGTAYGEAADRLIHLLARLRRYDEAEQLATDVARTTRDSRYRTKLADLYKQSGNHYAAQRQYEEIIAVEPDNSEALFNLAQSYEATGNIDRARDCYARVSSQAGTVYESARRAMLQLEKNSSVGSSIDPDSPSGYWLPARMPLKVFVVATGTGSEIGIPYVRQAVESWNMVQHDKVSLALTDSEKNADIVVTCMPKIPDHDALGVAYRTYQSKRAIRHADVQISTGVDSSNRTLPAYSPATARLYEAHGRMLQEVSLHELGHALGLSHSTGKEDIMSNGIYGLASSDVLSSRSLTVNDGDRLRNLYRSRDKALALAAASAKGQAANKTTSASEEDEEYFEDDAEGTPAEPSQASGVAAHPSSLESHSVSVTSKARDRSASVKDANVSKSLSSTAIQSVMFNLRCGNFSACVSDLNMILIAEPRNVEAHYLMAVTMVNLRKYQEAAKHYKEVLKLQPNGNLANMASSGLAKLKI